MFHDASWVVFGVLRASKLLRIRVGPITKVAFLSTIILHERSGIDNGETAPPHTSSALERLGVYNIPARSYADRVRTTLAGEAVVLANRLSAASHVRKQKNALSGVQVPVLGREARS